MGSQPELQARLDRIVIDGLPLLSELEKFHAEVYAGLPGAPSFGEFVGRLAYRGMQAVRAELPDRAGR